MNAREQIAYHLWQAVPSGDDAKARAAAAEMLDAHRTEVFAEADLLPKADVVAWLVKKAREFRAGGTQKAETQANAVLYLASKVSRGAVRPDNLRMLPDPGFFEVDRIYISGSWEFRCEAISASPGTGERRALGWKFAPVSGVHGWHAVALDPDDWAHGGWTDTTGEVTS